MRPRVHFIVCSNGIVSLALNPRPPLPPVHMHHSTNEMSTLSTLHFPSCPPYVSSSYHRKLAIAQKDVLPIVIGVGSACLNHERFRVTTTIRTIRVAVDDLTRTTAVTLPSQNPASRSSSQRELWNLALPCILEKRYKHVL